MDLVLSTLALALIPLGGAGLLRFLAPKGRPVSASDLAGLSLPAGLGLLPILLAGTSLLLRGAALRWGALLLLGAVAVSGYLRSRRTGDLPPFDLRQLLGTAALLAVAVPLGARIARGEKLGWDGVFIWELKARIVLTNDGRFPLSYFHDPTRAWSHPSYPPLLPLLESWLYGWLGRGDQILLDLLGVLQFVAAVLFVRWAGERLSGRAAVGFASAALFVFVPGFVTSVGSLGFSLGYADFLLGLLYGAALVVLILAAESDDPFLLRLGGFLTALLPLVKREGGLLALSTLLLAGAALLARGRLRRSGWIALPALSTALAWQLLLVVARTPPDDAFLPVTVANLDAGLPRLAELRPLLLAELLDSRHWSVLYPAALGVALLGAVLDPKRRLRRFVLVGGAFLPLLGVSAAYLLSRWPVADHAAASLPRVALHLAFPAFLVLVSAIDPPWLAKGEGGGGQSAGNEARLASRAAGC